METSEREEMEKKQEQFKAEMKRIFKVEELSDDLELKSVDSLSRAEIIVTAEEIFGVQLSDKQVLQLRTYLDLVTAVYSELKK